MKIKWILTVLIAVLTFELFCGDEIRKYQKSMSELEKLYTNALKADEKLRQSVQRERSKRKNRIKRYNINDDDDDDDYERNRRRSELRRLARQRRKNQKSMLEVKKTLRPHIIQHKSDANVLATKLREHGVRNSFAYYAKQVSHTFEVRGLDSDFENETFRLQKAYNPKELFVFITFDLNRLIANGIDLTSATPVPEKYRQYSTFMHFYQDLEFYRDITQGFNKAQNNSLTTRDELRRRCKRMLKNAERLDALLRKNNQAFADKMNVIKLSKMLYRHMEQHVFGQSDFLTDFQKQHSKTDITSPAEHSTNNFKEEFNEEIWVFDSLAEHIRICDPGDKSITKPKTRRKARKIEKVEPEFAKFFANDPALAPAQQDDVDDDDDKDDSELTAAEKRKVRAFVVELNAFREEYCGTIVAGSDGIAPEYIPTLKSTMTPAQQKLFDETFEEQKKKGKDPEDCAAAAYYKVRANELKKKYIPTDGEIEKIRKAMEQIKKNNVSVDDDNDDDDREPVDKPEKETPPPPPPVEEKPQTTEDDWG